MKRPPAAQKAKEHMWRYISAREMEAYYRLRVTVAKMLTAKIFYTAVPSTDIGINVLNPGVFMPEVELIILLFQTTETSLSQRSLI